jgi:hypothetical protein
VAHHPDASLLDDELHAPVAVGTQDAQAADCLQVAQRDLVGVAVLVAIAGGDERQAWPEHLQQAAPGGRVGPMVADLQHVDWPDQAPRQ